jgi:aconitate hydratase
VGCAAGGELPQWCSTKDVILEMLLCRDVKGGVNRIIEYYGPGLEQGSAGKKPCLLQSRAIG